ncbi:MAG: hypothetical protein QM770_17615 [Tepidisphaeraceae bacterium]
MVRPLKTQRRTLGHAILTGVSLVAGVVALSLAAIVFYLDATRRPLAVDVAFIAVVSVLAVVTVFWLVRWLAPPSVLGGEPGHS